MKALKPRRYQIEKISSRRFSKFNDWQAKIQRRNEFRNISEFLAQLYYSTEDHRDSKYSIEFLSKYRELARTISTISTEQDAISKDDDLAIKAPSEKISLDEIARIERATKQQSNSQWWSDLRTGRITASKAGYCYKMTLESITPDKLWRVVIANTAMAHGTAFEPLGIDALSKRHSVNIDESGFWIDFNRPWLGASPDGLIYENGVLNAIVEVKCPYSAKMDTISNWKTTPNSCIGMDGKLKPKHDYYYQIQMQMGITGTRKGLFGVYTGMDLHSEWIDFDEELWQSMIAKFDLIWKHLQDLGNKDTTSL